MSGLPIADRWFERQTVDDSVSLLWEPHVHPFLRCNIWHVRGRDRDILIDTGMGVASLADAASDLFDKPVAAVLTHVHMDHAGGAHEFDELMVHAEEAEALAAATNNIPLGTESWNADSVSWIAAMGYDISGGLLTAVPHRGFDPATHRLEGATASRILRDGDSVDTGDRRFEVLHLPGHSPGSIGLWEAASGTLFSGDALYDGPLLDEIKGSNIADYVRTMERLRDLPVRVVHGGHDPSFGRERLVELVEAYLTKRR